MTHKKSITWVAVVDGEKANFHTKGPERKLGTLNHTLTAHPIRTNPGTVKDLTRVFEIADHSRHTIGSPQEEHSYKKEQFAKEVAKYLDEELAKGHFNRLVLVAPPKTLGYLRKALSKEVKEHIALELDKEIANLNPKEVQEHIEEIVYI